MTNRRQFVAICLTGIGIIGVGSTTAAQEAVRELGWEDLTPSGKAVLLPTVSHQGPAEAQDLSDAATVSALDGVTVKMPGFIVPLAFEELNVIEFILAPYKGACIHVPAPPPNQLIHVQTEMPYPSAKMARPVWVTGVLQVEAKTTALAEIGYRMKASEISVYEFDR